MLKKITQQDMEQYGVGNAPDRLTGNPADVKAVFDRLVKEVVSKVVNEIIDAHNLLDTETARRFEEMGEELKNVSEINADNLGSNNIRLDKTGEDVLAKKFGLTSLVPTVWAALGKAVSAVGDIISGNLEVRNEKPSLRVGNENGVAGSLTYDVENRTLELGLVDEARKADEEYGESGFVLGDRDGYIPMFGAKMKIGLIDGLEELGFQPKFSTVEYDGSETEQTMLHTGNLGLFGAAQIKMGSYTGDGTYGVDNPNVLTFDFAPKLIMFFGSDGAIMPVYGGASVTPEQGMIFNPQLFGTEYSSGPPYYHPNTGQLTRSKRSSDGKTIWWYTKGNSASMQYNTSGGVYNYIAIG